MSDESETIPLKRIELNLIVNITIWSKAQQNKLLLVTQKSFI